MIRNRSDKRWIFCELPATEYMDAWDLQINLVDARKKRIIDKDIILFLEHPPVFTLGRRGGLENLRVSNLFLEKKGIPVIKIERGGNITFHGPGQVVIYPIIDLHLARLRVADYIEMLEEVMIRSCADFGIKAERHPVHRGIWAGAKKLGSLGIAIRRGICFHGIALNVNLCLEPFSWINPCGLKQKEMTSMEQEISAPISVNQVRVSIRKHIESVLRIELVRWDIEKLRKAMIY